MMTEEHEFNKISAHDFFFFNFSFIFYISSLVTKCDKGFSKLLYEIYKMFLVSK